MIRILLTNVYDSTLRYGSYNRAEMSDQCSLQSNQAQFIAIARLRISPKWLVAAQVELRV